MASKLRSVKKTDLATATKASVAAALKKAEVRIPTRPGTLAGFWLDQNAIRQAGVDPAALAKDVTRQVSAATGIRLRASVQTLPGGALVGYMPPAIRG